MSALIIGQFGGPTPVINASLAGVIRAAQGETAVSHIYGLRHGFEGLLRGEPLIELTHLSVGQIHELAQTPAAALGSSRYKLQPDDYAAIVTALQQHGARYFVPIGGNGSMYVAHRIAEASANTPLQVIGVPKTIDNDLAHIDHCPGYGSAARFLTLAVRDTGLDLRSMATFDDVTILEVMGRDTGWLAAATRLAKQNPDDAPHLIYVPEHPFAEDAFLADVQRVHQWLGTVFVVVSEGIRDANGDFVGSAQLNAHQDVLGRTIHSLSHGVASYLSDRVATTLGLQSRFLRPGLIGRASSACMSTTDQTEAMQLGQTAVMQLMAGHSGQMVTLQRVTDTPYQCKVTMVALANVAGGERPLPTTYINEAGNMITEAFCDYAMPLVGDPLPSYGQFW